MKNILEPNLTNVRKAGKIFLRIVEVDYYQNTYVPQYFDVT
jgi:hypothetical protein